MRLSGSGTSSSNDCKLCRMKSFESVGILGFGNMGEAIARGVLATLPGTKLHFFEKQDARAEAGRALLGDSASSPSPDALVASSEAILLAVKPQDAAKLLGQLAPALKSKVVISIMAGRTLAGLRELAGPKQLVRVMPNLAAARGQAFTALSFEDDCPAEVRDKAVALFDSVGSTIVIPEKLMPAFTGLSGSGIAFAFEFLHAMALAGTKAGFAYDASLAGSIQVVKGALALLEGSDDSPSDFITRICSPNGTTIEGMHVLHSRGFAGTVMDAVTAAERRSKELEN